MSRYGYAIQLVYDPRTPASECLFRCGRPEPPTYAAKIFMATSAADKGQILGSSVSYGAVEVFHLAHPECMATFQALARGVAV